MRRNMAAENYTTDKAKAKRLKWWSAALLVFSAAQLAIQVVVLVIFKRYYDDVESVWDEAYNSWTIASGAFDLMCSFFMICCLASSVSNSRNSSARCVIFLALTIALLSSVVSVAVSGLEIHWIRHSVSHPCQELNGTVNLPNCDLWFYLEVAVAVCAGLNTLFILIIVIVASKKSKVKQPSPTPERIPQQAYGEITVQQAAAGPTSAVTEEPVSTPLPEETEPEPQAPQSNETASEPGDEILTYAQHLRKMTREELEREMALQFQIKFLKELRVEIDRRNLFSTDQEESQLKGQLERVRRHSSRRSDTSSVASSVRGASRASSPRPPTIEMPRNSRVRSVSPPSRNPPPTPDYDLHEEII